MAASGLNARALVPLPEKDALCKEYVGKRLVDLPTPSFVVDRAVVATNCAAMHDSANAWEANFRAHVKTHKVCSAQRWRPLLILTPDDRRNSAPAQILLKHNTCRRSVHSHGSMAHC